MEVGIMEMDITLTVNGERIAEHVEVRKSLVDFVRDDLGLTGSHVGCEHGVCGACTMRVDGEIVRGCLMLAVQCDGAVVETIEGLSDSGELADLQAAFTQRNALQCGYCTPGMLTAAQDLLKRDHVPTREEIREHISGNYCRCTGYHAIVDAIESVAKARASSSSFRGASHSASKTPVNALMASEPGIQQQSTSLNSGSGAPHRPGMTKEVGA